MIAVRNRGVQRASYEIWRAGSKPAKAFLKFELEAPRMRVAGQEAKNGKNGSSAAGGGDSSSPRGEKRTREGSTVLPAGGGDSSSAEESSEPSSSSSEPNSSTSEPSSSASSSGLTSSSSEACSELGSEAYRPPRAAQDRRRGGDGAAAPPAMGGIRGGMSKSKWRGLEPVDSGIYCVTLTEAVFKTGQRKLQMPGERAGGRAGGQADAREGKWHVKASQCAQSHQPPLFFVQ